MAITASSRATTCSAPTDASSIIDYPVFAKQYIAQCEERHGIDAVEDLIDSCHALMNYGVDRYKRPYPISAEEERRRQKEREEHLQRQINDLWRTIPKGSEKGNERDDVRFPAEPQENILYFIENTRRCSSPGSAKWCVSCVRLPSTSTRSDRPKS